LIKGTFDEEIFGNNLYIERFGSSVIIDEIYFPELEDARYIDVQYLQEIDVNGLQN